MEGDLVLFCVICLLPLVLGLVMWLFFGKQRLQHSRGIRWLLLGNLLVFSFLCSTVLLTGEIYFRFFDDTTHWANSSRASQRWLKRHWHVNMAGFRDSVLQYSLVSPTGKRRVTFVGDSFTAGMGIRNVEDRFANLYRAKRPNREVQVLAECGWDTGHHLKVIRDYVNSGCKLDLVVLCYCLNDNADVIPEMPDVFEDSYRGELNYLCRHSYFLNNVYWRIQDTLLARRGDPYGDLVLRAYDGPVWELQQQRLRELRDLVAKHGGRLAVLTFPFLHESLAGPHYKYAHAHKQLAAFWKELGVPALDLVGVYQRYRAEELYVSRHDQHPNERAHALAADALVTFLDAVH